MTRVARPLRRQALATALRAQRQIERRALGTLKSIRLSKQARKRYAQAYARFGKSLEAGELAPTTFEEVDEAACAFIEATWHEGDPKLWCSDLLAALRFYLPSSRRQLHGG